MNSYYRLSCPCPVTLDLLLPFDLRLIEFYPVTHSTSSILLARISSIILYPTLFYSILSISISISILISISISISISIVFNSGVDDSGDVFLGGTTDDAYGLPLLLPLLPYVQISTALCLHQQRSIRRLYVVSQSMVEAEESNMPLLQATLNRPLILI